MQGSVTITIFLQCFLPAPEMCSWGTQPDPHEELGGTSARWGQGIHLRSIWAHLRCKHSLTEGHLVLANVGLGLHFESGSEPIRWGAAQDGFIGIYRVGYFVDRVSLRVVLTDSLTLTGLDWFHIPCMSTQCTYPLQFLHGTARRVFYQSESGSLWSVLPASANMAFRILSGRLSAQCAIQTVHTIFSRDFSQNQRMEHLKRLRSSK